MTDDIAWPPDPMDPTPERWARVKQLLADALEREGDEREHFLAESCAGDPELRREIDSLVDSHERSGALGRLAAEWVGPLLGRAEALFTDAQPPVEAGHYTVIERIGGGGMGVVYRARDVRLGRTVALKFLPPHLVTDAAAKERFLHEAQAAAAIDHPNVCTVFDVGDAPGGRLYIAMPLYGGETLERRLARGPLSVDEAANIALQVARGLGATHDREIIHRDLKPANLFVTTGGLVKILDFGIAKLSGVSHTASGVRLGTAAYMSPEQARVEPVDHRTDVWSLGAVLYEMLAGRRAFPAGDEAALVQSILHEDVTPLRTVRPDVPADLERIVTAMLSRDPALRPASMRDLEDRLSSYAGMAGPSAVSAPGLHRATGSAEPAPTVERSAARRRAMRLAAGALAAAALAAVIVRTATEGSSSPNEKGNVVAVFPFAVAGSSEADYLREGMASLLSTQLDGAGELRTVDARAVLAAMGTARASRLDGRTGRAIAARLGAGTFVLGDAAEAGGRLRLHATLYERGTARGAGEAEGPASDLFTLVDELAAELLAATRGGTGGRLSRSAALTTTSLPALKAYLNGERAYRADRYEEAAEWFRSAVAHDTSFALAYFHLALAARQLTVGALTGEGFAGAARHADRLSPRDRRLVEASLTWADDRYLDAAEQLRALLGSYPDEVEAWNELGLILLLTNPLQGRPISEAREPFQRAAALDPRSPYPVRHLVYVAAAEHDVRAVDSLIARLDSLGGRGERWFEMEALRVATTGTPAARRSFLAALDTAGELQVMMSADVAVTIARDFEGSEQSARLLTRPERSVQARSVGHSWLARLHAARGQWRQAMLQVDSLRRVNPDAALDVHAELATLPFAPVTSTQRDSLRRAIHRSIVAPAADPGDTHWYHGPLLSARPATRIYLAGALALLGGDVAAARDAAARLGAADVGEDSARRYFYRNLATSLRAAGVAREGNDGQALQALDSLRSASVRMLLGAPLGGYPPARLLRAELLMRLGRPEEGLPWCTNMGYASFYDVTYLPAAHRCAEQILTRLGREREASRHRDELRRLWERADPELRDYGTRFEK